MKLQNYSIPASIISATFYTLLIFSTAYTLKTSCTKNIREQKISHLEKTLATLPAD